MTTRLNPEAASINDLFPNEILEKIFCRVESQPCLLQARLVCHRWMVILDEMVGYSVLLTSFHPIIRYLTNGEVEKFATKNLKPISSMKNHINMSIRHLKIGIPGLLVNEYLTEMVVRMLDRTTGNFPDIPFPHVLKSISCFEPLCPDFLTVLSSLHTLQELNLSLFSLLNLDTLNDSPSSKILLRSLKCLTISEALSYPVFNGLEVMPQLSALLDRLQTPSLQKLEVTYLIANLLDASEDSTRHVMGFLERSPTIRDLSIGVSSPSQNFVPPTKDFVYPPEIQEEMKVLGSKLNLTSAHLKDNHLHSLRPSLHVKGWTALFKEQRNLHSLEFSLKSSIELCGDVLPVILESADTLKSLTLACFPCEICTETRDVTFVVVDCTHLQKCECLENLRISDKIINTINLPTSLKRIFVDAMLTNREAHNILISLGDHLEKIELKDSRGGTPKGFGFGVEIESLEMFVQKRRVARLIIYSGCTDGKYPASGIPNGDPLHPRKLYKLKPPLAYLAAGLTPEEFEDILLECVRIDWRINERGYYADSFSHEKKEKPAPEASSSSSNNDAANNGSVQHSRFKSSSLLCGFH